MKRIILYSILQLSLFSVVYPAQMKTGGINIPGINNPVRQADDRFRLELTPPSSICKNKKAGYSLNIYGGDGFSELTSVKIDWGDNSTPDVINSPAIGSHALSHIYSKRGIYTVTITPYAGTDPITQEINSKKVKVGSGILPVNHNPGTIEY